MKIAIAALIALCLASFSAGIAPENGKGLSCLETVSNIRLPGRTVRFDYQSIDPEHRLLFIAHLGDNSVTVFDLKSQRVLKNITGIPGPHGLLAVPSLGRVYVSATSLNETYTIDEKSLKIVGKTPAGYFPDGVAYAPEVERIFVSDEFGKTVTVIDAVSLKLVGKIEIGGTVGNTHFDPVTNAIYTADESANELLRIDPETLKITQRIELPGCRGAHGFVIGSNPHFAYVTGEDNASLVVVDLARKKVIQEFDVGREPDVLAIDKGVGLLYVSSESGVVSVFKIGTQGLSAKCAGKLWAHAHTVSVDQTTHKVYFPLQDWKGSPTLRMMVPRNVVEHPAQKGRE